jgi:NhaP-type Na+/H+ or K+/H+ antiporter
MLLSVVLILGVGLSLGFLFDQLELPSLLGMLLAGILLGGSGFDLLADELLVISQDIRQLALIIILLRAGLGISKETLLNIGRLALKLSFIPILLEGGVVFGLGIVLLNLSWLEAGMLAFIIAAVSPAVIVPSMLRIKEQKLGQNKEIPTLILASASVDDVLAISLFGLFLNIFQSKSFSSLQGVFYIPAGIIGGILLGLCVGYLLDKFFTAIPRLDVTYQIIILLITAISVNIVGDYFQLASLLAVMSIGYILLEKNKHLAEEMSAALNKLWVPAKVFLFVLIGAAVQIKFVLEAGIISLVVIGAGLLARSIGVLFATIRSKLTIKERLFCIVAYLPKATVQAAIGAVPLAAGVPNGELILTMAVLSIVVTAPLGAIGIKQLAPKLLASSV